MTIAIVVFVMIVAVAIGTLTAFELYRRYSNARLARRNEELNRALDASHMLQHAVDYLTPLGPGSNLEWANARTILEIARFNVLYEVK